MLTIKVEIFGLLRRSIGKKELTFEVEEDSTLEDVILQLVKTYPSDFEKIFHQYSIDSLSFRGNILYILLNGSNIYLLKDRHRTGLSKNDVISLIPIVSGG